MHVVNDVAKHDTKDDVIKHYIKDDVVKQHRGYYEAEHVAIDEAKHVTNR